MKPIGNNSDTEIVAAALTSDKPVTDAPAVTAPRPDTRSTSGVRIEDIIGVAPRSVRDRDKGSAALPSEEFYTQLRSVLAASQSPDEVWQGAATTLQLHAGFDFVARFSDAGSQVGQSAELQGLTADIESLSVQSQQVLHAAVNGCLTSGTRLPTHTGSTIAVPIDGDVLIGVLAPSMEDASATHQRCILELTATRISEWHIRHQLQQSEQHVQHVAAIVDLTGRISGSRQPDHAAKRMTEDLCRYLNAQQVYLGTCKTPRAACRLTAISNTEVDRLSKHGQQAEAVLQESVARADVSIWPSANSDSRHALLSHQQFATEQNATSIVAAPLRIENSDAIGAVFVTFDETTKPETVNAAATFLRAAEQPVAAALEALTRTSQGIVSQFLNGTKRILGGHRWKIGMAMIAAFCAAMFVPVDYRVKCDSELQPVSRRFVAAPFDAPLKECLIEPGDVVEAGQLLALLDGRELRWELSGLRADIGKATKEHNAFLSERESGEAAIARHEIDRLQTQVDLLTNRTKNLEIRSPMAGIVVAGDLRETEGVPLQTGQSMFEIAPLDRMIIEVAIPEEDVRHVASEMSVRLILDAMPAEAIDAKIIKLNPRAELRDHENVFIAEAEIDNTDRRLRPGMRGQAKVSTGTHPLGWTLFHKPLAHAVGWLGW